MDTLYIGAKYDIGTIAYSDGSAFSAAPYVVLYSQSSKHYFEATVTQGPVTNTYAAIVPANVTINMIPGVYALEIYSSSAKTEMLYRNEEFTKAINAASSADAQVVESSNS